MTTGHAFCLEIPEGLEHPCQRWLLRDGFGTVETVRPGLLAVIATAQITALPRYCYGLRQPLATATGDQPPAGLFDAAATAVLPAWLNAATDRYRFWVEGRTPAPAEQKDWLARCRSAFAAHGLQDAPSDYTFEVVLSFLTERPTLYLRRTQLSHGRFDYRVKDVPAAINPVLAAALVRLLPENLGGATIDPTCGSGTLLIERKMFCPSAIPIGIDLSQDALAAATANLAAARLTTQATLLHADAQDGKSWRPCAAVLANLPFGNRVGKGSDLVALYKNIMANGLANLVDGGRILLASAHKSALDQALRAQLGVKVLAKYRVQSGGLFVQVLVLGQR